MYKIYLSIIFDTNIYISQKIYKNVFKVSQFLDYLSKMSFPFAPPKCVNCKGTKLYYIVKNVSSAATNRRHFFLWKQNTHIGSVSCFLVQTFETPYNNFLLQTKNFQVTYVCMYHIKYEFSCDAIFALLGVKNL